jgi:riboflavin biosynthesis pyrimidine reductase
MRIIACLASSVDGKITAAQLPPNQWAKLGTTADLERLFTIRNQADAILCGLTTFNAWAGVRWSTNQQAQPLEERIAKYHLILTNTWHFTAAALTIIEQWQPNWLPFIVVSNTPPPAQLQTIFNQPLGNHIWLQPTPNSGSHPLQTIIEQLTAQYPTIQTLLVEGGGNVIAQCLEAQILQELYLTLTPWLVGGTATPSLVGGIGFEKGCFPKVLWQSIEPVEAELFLHGSIQYPSST